MHLEALLGAGDSNFDGLDRGQALIYAPSDGQPRTPSACQFESDARTLLRSDDLAGYSHAHHEIDMWAGVHWPTLLLPSSCRSLAGLAYVDDAGPRQSDTFLKWYTVHANELDGKRHPGSPPNRSR